MCPSGNCVVAFDFLPFVGRFNFFCHAKERESRSVAGILVKKKQSGDEQTNTSALASGRKCNPAHFKFKNGSEIIPRVFGRFQFYVL
mmetsp:Transcript_18042/g.41396  ORF Transcript_18042/g.41396 Transcript_18042/m.41396 type:complete len:87 (-) Transcript_18042:26-286(-)